MSEVAPWTTTHCGHRFHPACLQQWRTFRLDCPMCRAILPP
jgi:hypothetical protein